MTRNEVKRTIKRRPGKQLRYKPKLLLMKPTRLLLFVLLFPCLIFAQVELKKADAQFASQQYYNARDSYKNASAKAKSKEEKARIYFQIGECNRMLNLPGDAVHFYSQAIANGYTDDIVYLRRADMYHMLGQCANANNDYMEYKKRVPSDAATADAGIQACGLTAQWSGEKTRWKISDQKDLNTPTNDFCPMWSDKKHNGLVISSKRSEEHTSELQSPL